MPSTRVRTWASNLGVLLASTALVVAAGEWFVRRYLPVGGFLYRLHPRTHYDLAPGTRTLFVHTPQNGGGSVLVTVNSQGFRGDELRAGGDPRVVVYGDSCIEADYARQEETFVRRLEAHLAEAGRRVEVVNAGVNGWGPDQSLRRFQDEAGRLQPALVVFTVFADNDFGDLVRNRLYRLEGDRLAEAGGLLVDPARQRFAAPAPSAGFRLMEQVRGIVSRSRRRHRLSGEEKREKQQRAMAGYLRASLQLCRREYDEAVLQGRPLISDLVNDHYDADLAFEPDSAAAGYKRALMAAVLREVRATAERAGVKVLVLVVPSPIDACDACEIPVDGTEFPHYDRQRLTAEAAGAAERAGLPVLDLFAPFREAGPDRLYYRRPEDHWNARGQDLAARLASARVVREGWLAAERR